MIRLKAKGEAPAPSFADKLAKLSAGFPLKARLQAPELWAGRGLAHGSGLTAVRSLDGFPAAQPTHARAREGTGSAGVRNRLQW